MQHVERNIALLEQYKSARNNTERFEQLLKCLEVGSPGSRYVVTRDGNTFYFDPRGGQRCPLAVYISARKDFDFKNPNLRAVKAWRTPVTMDSTYLRAWKPLLELLDRAAKHVGLVTEIVCHGRDSQVHRYYDVEVDQMHFVVDKMVMTLGGERLPAFEIPSCYLFDYLDQNYARPVTDDDVVTVFLQNARVVINVGHDSVHTNLRPKQFMHAVGA